jgi:hypothetical protein
MLEEDLGTPSYPGAAPPPARVADHPECEGAATEDRRLADRSWRLLHDRGDWYPHCIEIVLRVYPDQRRVRAAKRDRYIGRKPLSSGGEAILDPMYTARTVTAEEAEAVSCPPNSGDAGYLTGSHLRACALCK